MLNRFMPMRICALIAAVALAGCADGGTGTGAGDDGSDTRVAAAAPAAEQSTRAGHFQQLQAAGLKADYAAFAGVLKPADAQTVVAELQQSFGGRPFDVYTARSRTSSSDHKRVVELRGTGGRLYLYLHLNKVTGGWNLASYQMNRNRNRIINLL